MAPASSASDTSDTLTITTDDLFDCDAPAVNFFRRTKQNDLIALKSADGQRIIVERATLSLHPPALRASLLELGDATTLDVSSSGDAWKNVLKLAVDDEKPFPTLTIDETSKALDVTMTYKMRLVQNVLITMMITNLQGNCHTELQLLAKVGTYSMKVCVDRWLFWEQTMGKSMGTGRVLLKYSPQELLTRYEADVETRLRQKARDRLKSLKAIFEQEIPEQCKKVHNCYYYDDDRSVNILRCDFDNKTNCTAKFLWRLAIQTIDTMASREAGIPGPASAFTDIKQRFIGRSHCEECKKELICLFKIVQRVAKERNLL